MTGRSPLRLTGIVCAVLSCPGCHAVLPLDRAPDGRAGEAGATDRGLDRHADAPGACSAFVPEFTVTSANHSEKEDLDGVVVQECGSTYRVGDWDDITPHAKTIKTWADCLGLKHGDGLWVTRGGKRFWMTSRHYFIARHDHAKPREFLAHDHIDDHFVSLGSWYGLVMPVLCKKR